MKIMDLKFLLIILLRISLYRIKATSLSDFIPNQYSKIAAAITPFCPKTKIIREEQKTYCIPEKWDPRTKNVLTGINDVLDSLNYIEDASDWDLYWSIEYPFIIARYHEFANLRPHQKVNHIPALFPLTTKDELSTSGYDFMPKGFKLPESQMEFLQYAKKNRGKSWLVKGISEAYIEIVDADKIDLDSNSTFVQEFISNPLLVEGHKFDIGVYVVITSIFPLRVYMYNDVVLRFCSQPYHPFVKEKKERYLSGNIIKSILDMPGLNYYFTDLGFNQKVSFTEYVRAKTGKETKIIWDQIESSILTTILAKETEIIDLFIQMYNYTDTSHFFDVLRFDYIVDTNFKAYLLDINYAPLLSNIHFSPMDMFDQKLFYNVLALNGAAERVTRSTLNSPLKESLLFSHKNIAVFPRECGQGVCRNTCDHPICSFCLVCIEEDQDFKNYLHDAYREHINKGDFSRVFPPPMPNQALDDKFYSKLSTQDQYMYRWFLGKCLLDNTWC